MKDSKIWYQYSDCFMRGLISSFLDEHEHYQWILQWCSLTSSSHFLRHQSLLRTMRWVAAKTCLYTMVLMTMVSNMLGTLTNGSKSSHRVLDKWNILYLLPDYPRLIILTSSAALRAESKTIKKTHFLNRVMLFTRVLPSLLLSFLQHNIPPHSSQHTESRRLWIPQISLFPGD